MTTAYARPSETPQRFSTFKNKADKALTYTAGFWLAVTVLGQWIFAYYVTLFYAGAASRGDLQAWNQVLPNGYIPGDTMGNLAVGAHVILAIIIMIGGPLQLIPALRRMAPRFHRWTGRTYMVTALTTSVAGLFMVWTRGTVGDMVQHIGITLDAFLIITFAFLAWRYAIKRDLKNHRRWALRLFLVVSAVWFFRIGLMFWVFVNQGPAGFDPESFTGPFLSFWIFGQYLIPLAILQLYFYGKERAGTTGKIISASVLFLATVAMGIGTFAATMGMWLPRI